MSTKLKSSTKFLKLLSPLNPKPQLLLEPLNPKPQSSTQLHLSTQKPSIYNRHLKIINILKSNPKETWISNDQLTQSLASVSYKTVSQIIRGLGCYQTALHFVELLLSREKNPDGKSKFEAFQALLELAKGELGCDSKFFEVYVKAMEWGVRLRVDSGEMVDDFMRVYGELESHLRNVHVRNVVIDAFVRNRRFDDALEVLDEMLQPDFEVLPDEKTMEIVFSALLSGKGSGRWVSEEECVEMVARFGKRGLFPDSIWLTRCISSFCRSGRNDAAWELLHTVMELGVSVEVASCNALLTGLNEAGELDMTICLMKEMQEKGISPLVETLGISINNLCKSMRVEKALELFEMMRQGDLGADLKPDVSMYNTLINGLCKLGRIDEGLSMMRRMKTESECSLDTVTYNCLISGLCKEGEIDKALELVGEMDKEGVKSNIVTVNFLVSGFCRHGKASRALELYREMEEKGFIGNAKTYTTLISGFCGENNVLKAKELLDETKGKCLVDATVYYNMISCLSQAGLMDEANSVLTEMKSAGFRPDVGCYNAMIDGFCQKNKLDKVRQLLKDMESDGIKPDSFTYNCLISYFNNIGDRKTFRTMLQQMLKDDIEPSVVTYGAVINALCSVGELDEAMEIFKRSKHSPEISPNSMIYDTLIDCHCRHNMVKEALSLFDEMLGKGVEPCTNIFNALFIALSGENCVGKALELMDKMTEQGCIPDNTTWDVLVRWLSAVGEAEKLSRFIHGEAVSSPSLESEESECQLLP